MKKYLSVFELFVRTKLYKVLAIAACMAAVQIGAFRYYPLMEQQAFLYGNGSEILFLSISFGIAFFLAAFSSISFPSKKVKSSYTLMRLQIPEWAALLLDCLAASLMALIIWLTEILVVWYLAGSYQNSPGYMQGPQGIAIAFYRIGFLHSLVPMADKGLWIRNLLLVLSFGIACGVCSQDSRKGGKGSGVCFLAVMYIIFGFSKLPGELSLYSFLAIFMAAVMLPMGIFQAHKGKRRPSDDGKA